MSVIHTTIEGITLSAVRLDNRSVMVSVVTDNGSEKIDIFRAKQADVNSEGRSTDITVLRETIKHAVTSKQTTIKRILDRNQARSEAQQATITALTALGVKVIA